MKRVTVLFEDELLYRELKMAAAKEGRSVKDVVAEALADWLRRREALSPEQQRRRQEALRMSDELRAGQQPGEPVDDVLHRLRLERS